MIHCFVLPSACVTSCAERDGNECAKGRVFGTKRKRGRKKNRGTIKVSQIKLIHMSSRLCCFVMGVLAAGRLSHSFLRICRVCVCPHGTVCWRRGSLELTQHAYSQHEGVHPVGHHSGAAPGRACRRHHFLGLSFLTLHLQEAGAEERERKKIGLSNQH